MPKQILIFIILLSGCTSVQKKAPPNYSTKDFWQAQAQRARLSKRFAGKLTLQLSSKHSSAQGLGQVVSEKPGKARMEVRDPLGRMQLLMVTSPTEFAAYYPSRKTAYMDGVNGRAYLRQVLGLDLSYSDLESVLLGHVEPILKSRFDQWEWDGKQGEFLAKAETHLGPVELRIEPTHNVVSSIRVQNRPLEVRFANHRICCQKLVGSGVRLSHTIEVENSQSGSSLGVKWRDLGPAPETIPPAAFQPRVPKGTRRIDLK